VETGGYDAVTSTYDYAAPVVHSQGRYLVGFGEVTRVSPFVTEIATFSHDDDVAGLALTSEVFDERTPGLVQIGRHAYEEARFQGLRWRRPTSSASGWRGGDGQELVTTRQVLEYQREICPTRVEEALPGGTLRRELELASVAQLDDELHCLESKERLVGTHTVRARDFDYAVMITRDTSGLVTKVEQQAGNETLIMQESVYDPTTHRISSVSSPGRGTQTFTHDAATGLLKSTTAADGVIASVQSRDARTDALLELVGDRGPSGVLTSSFRYDGMERLAKRWADFGGSSEPQPIETIGYRLPTATLPGLIRISSLIDIATATRQQSASWFYPDGAELTSATRVPGQWVFGGVATASRNELRTGRARRVPLPDSADLALATYDSLREETTLLGENTAAGFGHESATREVIQQGVERRVATSLAIVEGVLVTSNLENDTFTTSNASDAGGRVVWVRDQNNAKTQYQYDALGRLVGVTLPDGVSQQLSFDAFGRPAQVTRGRIGTIRYVYEPVTSRLARKEYRDRAGALERTCRYEYDAIGRVAAQVHVKAATEAETRFTYRYDGNVGDREVLAGQKGYTTQIEGSAYTSTTIHNPDGTVASSSIVLAEWMQIDNANTYYAGGALKESHRVVTRLADGAIIDDVTTGYLHDASGRPDRVTVNGEVVATAIYDGEGRVASVEVVGGQRIEKFYDPATHRETGYSQEITGVAGTWQTGVEWTFNSRGFIASEALDIGDQSLLRSYRYDQRGFLTRSVGADQLSTYSYTAAGLPNQVTDELGTRTVFRGNANTLTVSGIRYEWDSSGRLLARGGATFTYGPDGHLSEAQIGGRSITYAYDAEGNRLLKFEDGAPVAAFVGGAYLTDDTVVAPIKGGGRLLGVLEGGEFQLQATDPRGTVLADRDGTPRLASPYGVRETRPDLSAALDYVEKGYDADLATVRMGVRDYDPLLGQFWTPDPLYLEAIEKCAESPVECNLFGYALNDPLRYIDPDGRGAWTRIWGAVKVVGLVAGAVAACGASYGAACGIAASGALVYGEQALREVMSGESESDLVTQTAGPTAGKIAAAAFAAYSLGQGAQAINTWWANRAAAGAGEELVISMTLDRSAKVGSLEGAIAEGTAAGKAAAVEATAARSGATVNTAAAARAPAAQMKPFTAGNFRANLGQQTGGIPKGVQAHHVFPKKFATQFRNAGINIHNPRYGAWWQAGPHQRAAAAYNRAWGVFFRDNPNPTAEQIFRFGREIANRYGLTINF